MTDMVSWLVITIAAAFVIHWFMTHKIIPYFVLKKLKRYLDNDIKSIIQQLKQAYQPYNSAKLSKHAQQAQGINTREFTYGEIVFESFIFLLGSAALSENDTFVDLGSGTGKAVIAASVFARPQATIGIEYLAELNQVGTAVSENLGLDNTSFITGDFYTTYLNDASVIFINATALTESQWLQLANHLKTTQPGTRIIVTSHRLSDPKFELIEQGQTLMSWGMVSYRIYCHAN